MISLHNIGEDDIYYEITWCHLFCASIWTRVFEWHWLTLKKIGRPLQIIRGHSINTIETIYTCNNALRQFIKWFHLERLSSLNQLDCYFCQPGKWKSCPSCTSWTERLVPHHYFRKLCMCMWNLESFVHCGPHRTLSISKVQTLYNSHKTVYEL